MSGINSGSRKESTLDQIVKGLNAANQVLGGAVNVAQLSKLIKENDKENQDKIKFDQDQNTYKQENSPDSPQSKRARTEEAAIIRSLRKKGTIDPESESALLASINGNPSDKKQPPMSYAQMGKNSPLKDLVGLAKGDQSAINIHTRNDSQDERQAQLIHDRVISRIQKDPTLMKQLGGYQGLENAMSLITKSDHITTEQFHEFQQAVRSSIGIKGTGGVDERAATYLKSLGLSSQSFIQFLTGEPQDMGKNHPFIKHIKQLANIEQSNILNNFNKRLDAMTGGHASLYQKYPHLKMDLNKEIESTRAQIESSPDLETKPEAMKLESLQDQAKRLLEGM